MAVWIRDLLAVQFWALNMVSFVIALLLVLYAVQLSRAHAVPMHAVPPRRAQACWQPGRMTRHCRRPLI